MRTEYIITDPPAYPRLRAPLLYPGLPPFTQRKQNRAILPLQRTSHTVISFCRGTCGPVVARRSQQRVIDAGAVRAGGGVVVGMAVVVGVGGP